MAGLFRDGGLLQLGLGRAKQRQRRPRLRPTGEGVVNYLLWFFIKTGNYTFSIRRIRATSPGTTHSAKWSCMATTRLETTDCAKWKTNRQRGEVENSLGTNKIDLGMDEKGKKQR